MVAVISLSDLLDLADLADLTDLPNLALQHKKMERKILDIMCAT